MKIIFFNICIFCIIHLAHPQDQSKLFFDQADNFFSKYVKEGKVDYKRVKENNREIQALRLMIENQDLEDLNVQEKKAFYINAYNLIVIDQLAKIIPVKENWYQDGFFNRTKHRVAGEEITLDVLEKDRLWNIDKDPKIHFVLVCGAKGCPPLRSEAYKPNNLEEQLEGQTVKTLNDIHFIKIDNKRKHAAVSELFSWYKKDFLIKDNSIIDFINRYRTEKIPSNYNIIFYPYDWKVNNI